MNTLSTRILLGTNGEYIVGVVGGLLLIALFLRSRSRSSESIGPAPTPSPINSATRDFCATLTSRYPAITYTREDDELQKYRETYWAAQARASTPALLVKPRNTSQLADIVKVLAEAVKSSTTDEPVKFTVRSGGHSPVEGFANVESGVVIDLSGFQAIELSDDGKSVTIEPGADWGMVYQKLESYALAVAGGRASSVGVGGLTLGGGLSFFSPQVGFVCDAILEFEIVLANGSIVTASDASHSDLAIALRGGGNNFGIVTKFTARTFPQTDVWMGHLFHWPSASERLIQTYYDFGEAKPFDSKATVLFIFTWAPYLPCYLPVSCLNYAESTPHPPSLRGFSKERRFWNTLRVRTLAKATDVIVDMSPSNFQDLFHTTTFENDLETTHYAHLAFKESLANIKKIPGIVWSLVFQPLVPSATLHHASNAMGINTDKTLTVMHASIVWKYRKDDALVHKAAEDLIDRVEAFARQRGVYHPYKYANYCSAKQNPYPGYGPERHEFLRSVSRMYDPDGIFQEGVPGHKLWS